MAFLDGTGLQHFINKVIGKADISKVGDGTLKGAVKTLSDGLVLADSDFTTGTDSNRDADTLGGKYKSSDLDTMKNQISTLNSRTEKIAGKTLVYCGNGVTAAKVYLDGNGSYYLSFTENSGLVHYFKLD